MKIDASAYFFEWLSHNNYCGLRLKRLLFWQFCWSRLNHKINIHPLNFLRLLLLCLVRFGTFLLLNVCNQINSFDQAVWKIVTCMRTKRMPAARRRTFHLLCKLTVKLTIKKKRIMKSFQFFKTVKSQTVEKM